MKDQIKFEDLSPAEHRALEEYMTQVKRDTGGRISPLLSLLIAAVGSPMEAFMFWAALERAGMLNYYLADGTLADPQVHRGSSGVTYRVTDKFSTDPRTIVEAVNAYAQSAKADRETCGGGCKTGVLVVVLGDLDELASPPETAAGRGQGIGLVS